VFGDAGVRSHDQNAPVRKMRTIQSSPSRTAVLRRPARSEPAEGSEKSWHQISSPESSLGTQRSFCRSVPWASSVGPHIPMPIPKISGGVLNFACSSLQITFCMGVAARPPYSLGHVMQAQPASAFFFCQAWAVFTVSELVRSTMPPASISPGSRRSALASSQARASARKEASSGVSLKSISRPFRGLSRIVGLAVPATRQAAC